LDAKYETYPNYRLKNLDLVNNYIILLIPFLVASTGKNGEISEIPELETKIPTLNTAKIVAFFPIFFFFDCVKIKLNLYKFFGWLNIFNIFI
jgi:hypothetical protein